MSDSNLTDYRLDNHDKKLDVMQALLTTHVDDDHEIQSEISSDIKVIKVQMTSIMEEMKKLTSKTSTTWDYVQKALGAAGVVTFLLMAFKYLT